jgi:hypothetical protein
MARTQALNLKKDPLAIEQEISRPRAVSPAVSSSGGVRARGAERPAFEGPARRVIAASAA